jgi:hypothetical protein
MAQTPKKKTAPPDPHTLRMAKRARAEIERHGWSLKQLADRIGRSPDQAKRLLSPRSQNGRRHWSADDIFDVAGALGLSVEEMAGRSPSGTTFWDPRFDAPRVLADKFAEHQEHSSSLLAFNRILPCSVMTSLLQRQHYVSLFADFMNDPRDRRFCDSYIEFASVRRDAFLESGSDTKFSVTTLMLRSDFEKLVGCNPPFDRCTKLQVLQNLDFLRTECVNKRGFRLALIDDNRLPNHLLPRISFDSVLTVGNSLRVERRADYIVECSEILRRVDDAQSTLAQLARLVDFDPGDKRMLISEIERYMKLIEDRPDHIIACEGGLHVPRA